jgi:hypothetical protein
MYLWAPLLYAKPGLGDDGKPNELKSFKVGAEISQGSMSDEDWEYLIKTGVVRDSPYPVKDVSGSYMESPREVILRSAREAMEAAQQGMNLTGAVEVPSQ